MGMAGDDAAGAGRAGDRCRPAQRADPAGHRLQLAHPGGGRALGRSRDPARATTRAEPDAALPAAQPELRGRRPRADLGARRRPAAGPAGRPDQRASAAARSRCAPIVDWSRLDYLSLAALSVRRRRSDAAAPVSLAAPGGRRSGDSLCRRGCRCSPGSSRRCSISCRCPTPAPRSLAPFLTGLRRLLLDRLSPGPAAAAGRVRHRPGARRGGRPAARA